MNLENEVCRRVYEHHDVLKGEIGNALFETLTRAKLSKEAISTIVNTVNVSVDTSTDRMANDYQRMFKNVK